MDKTTDAVEILRKRYGMRWTVEYDRRFPEWDERSSPYLVDEKAQVVAIMTQRGNHPGKRDQKALDQAYFIRDAVNKQLDCQEVEPEYLEKTKKMEYGKCVRLYDKDGNHILSVLRCYDDEKEFDMATPDGNVVCCAPVTDYWPVVFAEHFPIEDTRGE